MGGTPQSEMIKEEKRIDIFFFL